jgi:hypothetical protein
MRSGIIGVTALAFLLAMMAPVSDRPIMASTYSKKRGDELFIDLKRASNMALEPCFGAGVDFSEIAKRSIPEGGSLVEAEAVLRYAGFELHAYLYKGRPPAWFKEEDRFNLSGTLNLNSFLRPFSAHWITVSVTPDSPGSPNAKSKGIKATYRCNYL